MYERAAGVRGNMNPPQFQLLVRPLTALPLETANGVFRALSAASLCGCLWWLWADARRTGDPWTAADVGAVLSWAAMASMIALNEVTWLIWPLLLVAWAGWRRARWTGGAVAFGLAMSLKPFLGVFLLWLALNGRWRAVLTAGVAALAAFGAAWVVYGGGVFRAWLLALNDVQWWWAPMNASLQGWLARTVAPAGAIDAHAPGWLGPLANGASVAVVGLALWASRRRSIDDSWRLLMVTALLASPLGWIYYLWWIVAGVRPARLLFRSPLLWVPFAYIVAQPSGRLAGATVASLYFWGLLLLYVQELRVARGPVIAASAGA